MVKKSGCEKIAAQAPMKRYLLPCSCSRRIVVAAGQAGGAVRCPDCGSERDVPRLGELGRLDPFVAEPAAAAGRAWGAAQAWVLAGVVTALLGASIAALLSGGRVRVAPLDERAIRESAAAAGADQVYQSWLVFARQGVARPPWGEEDRRLRHAAALGALETVAWIVAGMGCVVAVAAIAALVARPRSAAIA